MEPSTAQGPPATIEDLIALVRLRLLPVLWSRWGIEVGGDLCCEVEEYAWRHSDRLLRMANPLGYLYRVSQSNSRRYVRWSRRTTFPSRFPDVIHEDPSMHDVMQLLGGLSPDQRACVLLVHGFGWSYDDVAELLGMRRSTVNNHVHRGLSRLRPAVAATPSRVDAASTPPSDPQPERPNPLEQENTR
jgi:DNA-directed RNA polymerase specialized sigma24 family protein